MSLIVFPACSRKHPLGSRSSFSLQITAPDACCSPCKIKLHGTWIVCQCALVGPRGRLAHTTVHVLTSHWSSGLLLANRDRLLDTPLADWGWQIKGVCIMLRW